MSCTFFSFGQIAITHKLANAPMCSVLPLEQSHLTSIYPNRYLIAGPWGCPCCVLEFKQTRLKMHSIPPRFTQCTIFHLPWMTNWVFSFPLLFPGNKNFKDWMMCQLSCAQWNGISGKLRRCGFKWLLVWCRCMCRYQHPRVKYGVGCWEPLPPQGGSFIIMG